MNKKHKAFADNYLKDPERNARRAYQKVYTKVKDNVADAAASRLLKNVKVQDYINSVEKKVTDKVQLTNEMIIEEYRKLIYFDIRKLFNEEGNLKKIIDLDDDTAAAVSAIDVSTIYKPGLTQEEIVMEVTKKIKAIDKKGALDSMSRIRGMFIDRVEHTGSMTFEQFIKQKREKESKD